MCFQCRTIFTVTSQSKSSDLVAKRTILLRISVKCQYSTMNMKSCNVYDDTETLPGEGGQVSEKLKQGGNAHHGPILCSAFSGWFVQILRTQPILGYGLCTPF